MEKLNNLYASRLWFKILHVSYMFILIIAIINALITFFFYVHLEAEANWGWSSTAIQIELTVVIDPNGTQLRIVHTRKKYRDVKDYTRIGSNTNSSKAPWFRVDNTRIVFISSIEKPYITNGALLRAELLSSDFRRFGIRYSPQSKTNFMSGPKTHNVIRDEHGIIIASIWPKVIAAMSLLLLSYIGWKKWRKDNNKARCATCGYDLRGSPGPACPECGAAADPQKNPAYAASATEVGN